MGGRLSVGSLATRPKMSVNSSVVNRGWMMCHSGPRMVCLYCATKSRQTNSMVRSRYRHRSDRCRSNQPVLGRMTRDQAASGADAGDGRWEMGDGEDMFKGLQ